MSNRFELPPELSSLEAELRSLGIGTTSVDRSVLLYQAGFQAAQNSGFRQRTQWWWPASSALFATATLVLAILQLQTSTDRTSLSQIAHRETVSQSAPAPEPLPELASQGDRKNGDSMESMRALWQYRRGRFLELNPQGPTNVQTRINPFAPGSYSPVSWVSDSGPDGPLSADALLRELLKEPF